MDKNDDAPPIIPDTSHLGEEFENSYVSRPNTSISENSVQTVESTGYTDDEVFSNFYFLNIIYFNIVN